MREFLARFWRWLWETAPGGGGGAAPVAVYIILGLAALFLRWQWNRFGEVLRARSVPTARQFGPDRASWEKRIADNHNQLMKDLVSLKPIEQVRAGDQVVAYDLHQGKTVVATVRATTRRVVYRLRELQLRWTDQTYTILTTDDHCFWVEDQGWVPAARLKPGDIVGSPKLARLRVLATRSVARPDGVAVYNLIVEDVHTYHVALNGPFVRLLVHNINCVPLPQDRQWQVTSGIAPTGHQGVLVPPRAVQAVPFIDVEGAKDVKSQAQRAWASAPSPAEPAQALQSFDQWPPRALRSDSAERTNATQTSPR